MNPILRIFLYLVCTFCIAGNAMSQCTSPDAGGTVNLPALCPYTAPLGPMMIISGLPPGSTVQCDPTFDNFFNIVLFSGTPLTGETKDYNGTLTFVMQGTGLYAGFLRTVPIHNVQFRTAYQPRTPGNPIQSFDADMSQVQGQLPPGDPDFDLLRVTAGTDFGLPSPGHVTLTQNGVQWDVYSFFDLTYRIDFVGHPGGTFSGLSGSTTGTVHIVQGVPEPIQFQTGGFYPTDLLPPNGEYVSDSGATILYLNGMIGRNIAHHNFSQQFPPPLPGGPPAVYGFNGFVDMDVSMDGGQTFQPFHNIPGPTTVMVNPPGVTGDTRIFDTEMLQLDLSGPGFMIRESPAKASLGHTRIVGGGGGGYHIDSFFDVFTEMSLDGGQTWIPSSDSIRVHLQPLASKTGTICGTKWNDLNGNGTHDPGELGIEDWTIKLTLPDLSTITVVTDSNGNYCFPNLNPGHYSVEEVMQAGWTQTGGETRYEYDVLPGMAVSNADFGNVFGCVVCVRKYYDQNHNQNWDGLPDEPPMAGIIFSLDSGTTHMQSITDEDGEACFTGFQAGMYFVTEITPGGFAVSWPKGGFYQIECQPGQPVQLLWLNTAALTDTLFRTASYLEWATSRDAKGKLKSIKCKPDKVQFKLNLKVPPLDAAGHPFSILHIAFNMPVRIDSIWTDGKTAKQTPYLCASGGQNAQKPNIYDYTLSDPNNFCIGPPPPGLALQFDGYGLKGSKLKVSSYTWTTAGAPINSTVKGVLSSRPVVRGYDTLKQIPRLPMPNLVNVGENLQTQSVYPFTTGGIRDTSSVIYKKYNDVQKSMIKVVRGTDVFHEKVRDCLNVFDDANGNPDPRKPIKKQQKSLPPNKHNNLLFAEELTLQMNIIASDHIKFPFGFGSLIYDNHKNCAYSWSNGCQQIFNYCTDPGFDGKSVDSIMRQVNQYLSCKANPKNLQAIDYWHVLYNLNNAFSGCPIDTLFWSCQKLVLKGAVPLKSVPYLRANPGLIPPFTEPEIPVISQVEPIRFGLAQNYPNPFNPVTTISFTLPEDANVTLKVYNALGQEVVTLLDHEEFSEGQNNVQFDASNLPSGVYFYRVTAQGLGDPDAGTVGQIYTSVKKMVLLK